MKILLAEDEPVTQQVLHALVKGAGYDATVAQDGEEAWLAWQLGSYRLVVSDWLMPVSDGLELCRKIRGVPDRPYTYFILLTGKSGRENYLAAMDAGVDDFITKPVDGVELKARLKVAERILGLRQELDQLEGLLPICAYCKRIRDDRDQWQPIERYVEQRSEAQFSHGICPDCRKKHLEPHLQ